MSDQANAATTEESKGRSGPKGWWVNPPKEIKELIEERCEESLRDPQQEIVWLLRDWYRKVYQAGRAQTEQPATKDPGVPE